jgi:hypothetical protein
MPAYEYCKQCPVTKALHTLLEQYEYFLKVSSTPRFVYMTDHARGNHHGKVSSIEEFISDLREIIPYVEAETVIRGGR